MWVFAWYVFSNCMSESNFYAVNRWFWVSSIKIVGDDFCYFRRNGFQVANAINDFHPATWQCKRKCNTINVHFQKWLIFEFKCFLLLRNGLDLCFQRTSWYRTINTIPCNLAAKLNHLHKVMPPVISTSTIELALADTRLSLDILTESQVTQKVVIVAAQCTTSTKNDQYIGP